MNQVYTTLPDDRPVTSLQIVEDVDKCPKGFLPVSKTYDQDSDADLWREGVFFGKKNTRYLCISKSEGIHDFVIQSLLIIGEKETPPLGFNTILKTYDSDQKAWRKKQLCYKFAQISTCQTAITDIIILSKMKKAPEEFLFLGEINGITLCYKIGKVGIANNSVPSRVPYFPVSLQHGNSGPVSSVNSSNKNLSRFSDGRPEKGLHGTDLLRPFRPAPKPPTSAYSTISGYSGLEGVPFILNPKFKFSNNVNQDISVPKIKTKSQIDAEYNYEFRTERET